MCNLWPWNICVTNDHGYVPLVVNTSQSFPHSWLITGIVTRLTWRVLLVEQELTLPEHLSSPPGFSGVCVTRPLVLYVFFVNGCLSFCAFSFDHCVVCSSIYCFWMPLWQSSKLDFRIYWAKNTKIRIYIDSIEKFWPKSLVRINFHWTWATRSLLCFTVWYLQTLLEDKSRYVSWLKTNMQNKCLK